MEDRRAFLVAALATMLFLVALRTFLSSIYFLNLETLELNETAAYALLLLAPVVLLVPPLARRPRTVLLVAAAVLAVGGVLTGLAQTAAQAIGLAGATSAAYLLIFPLLLHLGRAIPVAAGIAVALAFDVARLFAGDSAEPLPAALHLTFLALLGIAVFLLVLRPAAPPIQAASGRTPRTELILAGLGLGAWLFLQTNVWASAHHVARWNDAPIVLIAAGTILGLALGTGLLLRYTPRPTLTRALLLAQALPVLLLVDHTLLHSPILPVTLLLAQSVLVIDLAVLLHVLSRAPVQRLGLALFLGMLLFLVLAFAFVFTFTFAFVPLRALWEGREGAVLLLAVAVVLGAALRTFTTIRYESNGNFPRSTRDRRAVAVFLVFPLLVGLVAATSPDATTVAPEDETLRVLSFNVHQGFNNDGVLDPDLFVRLIQGLDPDLVSLQESDTPRITSGNLDIADILSSRLGYHTFYGPPTRAQSFGVAILSRYPIEETYLTVLPSDADNRHLVGARVHVNGTDVSFFAIHMGLAHGDRLAQLDSILTETERIGGRRILAGDFNSCPSGHCPGYAGPPDTVYEQVTARYTDTWSAAGNDADDPAGYTYTPSRPDRRIDFIFVSDGFTVEDATVVRTATARAASDHLPVLSRITLDDG